MKILLALYLITVCTFAVIAASHNSVPTKSLYEDDVKLKPEVRDVININGTFYFVSSLQANFYQAARMCNDLDMKLISIQTEEKAQSITHFFNNNGYSMVFWTSGVRVYENYFMWSGSGEFFSFARWMAGQPTQPKDTVDVCVYAYSSTAELSDWMCSGSNFYVVCEEIC